MIWSLVRRYCWRFVKRQRLFAGMLSFHNRWQIGRKLDTKSLPRNMVFLASIRDSSIFFKTRPLTVPLLMSVVVFPILYSAAVEGPLPFKNQCLKWHNNYRLKHQVQPVKWNSTIAKGATDWARYLAENNLFKHARKIPFGENLFMAHGKPQEPCTMATKAFYGEIKNYDFKKPGFSVKTGHFTQVVWKNTKQIGAAQATRKDGKLVVVIRYSPPGNNGGKTAYEKNVLPLQQRSGCSGQRSLPFSFLVIVVNAAAKYFL